MSGTVQRRKKQLLIDVSYFNEEDRKTGIHRVLRSTLQQLLKKSPSEYLVRPVYATSAQSGYFYANRCMRERFGAQEFPEEDDPIFYEEGDIFLVGLDFSTHSDNYYKTMVGEMRLAGVKLLSFVYDLLPVELPQWYPPIAERIFKDWLETIVHFDGAICGSRSTANALKEWVKKNHEDRVSSFKINWIHLGCDVENSVPTTGLPTDADVALSNLKRRPVVLMVGSLKPRKGYFQALDAFEELWARNLEVNFAIVGKHRYQMENFVKRLNDHPEKGNRLFWFDAISDEYLEKIYSVATVVMMAAENEGFGLPVVEAARKGKPLILRDIDVFREIAGEHAFYFSGLRPTDVADAIQTWFKLRESEQVPLPQGMKLLTWKESTEMLLNCLS